MDGSWLGLNVPWGKFGIHGTLDPHSVGWASSHGCIRMNNSEVAELYKIVPVGTKVTIVDGVYGPFGKGFRDLKAFLATLNYDKLFILTDTNTQEKCYPLIQDVPAIKEAPVITVDAGDTHKGLEALSNIWMRLSNEGASRNSLLVNLGGGMVTDMGGFAGATFKRGLKTVNIPTTLMASVDAAVGGKTGINFNGLKNEIGSFYPPECVFIDCEFLRKLNLGTC